MEEEYGESEEEEMERKERNRLRERTEEGHTLPSNPLPELIREFSFQGVGLEEVDMHAIVPFYQPRLLL